MKANFVKPERKLPFDKLKILLKLENINYPYASFYRTGYYDVEQQKFIVYDDNIDETYNIVGWDYIED